MKGYIQTCLLALAAVALGQTGLSDLPDCAVRTLFSPPHLIRLFFWVFRGFFFYRSFSKKKKKNTNSYHF